MITLDFLSIAILSWYTSYSIQSSICMSSESLVLLRRGTDPGDPYSYTINSVDVDDTGLYSCVAGNILGETVNIAHLEVNRGHPASHRGQDQPHHPSDKSETQTIFALVMQ